MINDVVIVGAGQAGFQAAASLRDEGFDGHITLVGDEPGLPYQRPPLSKAFLLGKTTEEGLYFRPERYFASKSINFLSGEKVVSIDRPDRRVILGGGAGLAYDHLILATGAQNRRLVGVDGELEGLYYLRSLAEAKAVSEAMDHAESVVVIGAGFIGLEFAAVARARGLKVHVLDLAPRPLMRAVSPAMSAFFARQHAEWGIDLRCAAPRFVIRHSGNRIIGVELESGEHVPADLIVVGIGVVPNVEAASDAGLEISNGIVVNQFLTTSDPQISAIGDCAAFPNPFASGLIRLESVQNAADQARAVAAKIVGRNRPYGSIPWFWSDQGDIKLQIVGLTAGFDRAIPAGNPEERSFSIFCFQGSQLVGIESVNQVSTHMAGRRLLQRKTVLRPEDVEKPSFNLKQHEAEATLS